MNQILYSERSTKNSNKKIIISILILLIVVFFIIFIISNMLKDKIFANIYVGDIDIGMQTKENAKESIVNKITEYQNFGVTINLNNNSIDYTAYELGLDIEKTVDTILDDAYEYGRDKGFFQNASNMVKSYFEYTDIPINLEFDNEKLNMAINELVKTSDVVATDDSYEISGDKIFIKKGHDGNKVDYELSKSYIATAILNGVKNVDIPVVDSNCVRINLEKLYDEVYVAPKNASYVSGDMFEVIVDEPGVYFDLEKAKSDYENLQTEGIMSVELKKSEADIKVADLDDELFGNVLATFSNSYDQSVTGRVQNLKVAAQRCNNTILYPGDEFSYNKALRN